MAASGMKLIDASGRDGQSALEFINTQPEAPRERHGKGGRSAGDPTDGAPGSEIAVRLAYAEPSVVHVIGGSETEFWTIASGETLLLRANGGNGGTGGRGEHGQDGGPGRCGCDATRYRLAGRGGNGGNGGDAGFGSNGADGGSAGNVYVTVAEDDTDLLSPLYFSVKGGSGGESGAHGAPGEGGQRGRGGKSHCEVCINVNRGDDTVSTYPGVYKLEVVRFDITDENQDGINEPGEHLLVHNLVVRNAGLMPSPATRSIHVLIQGTQYLEPVSSEPLQLPFGIRPGQEVEVSGLLRAFIRDQAHGEPVGSMVDVNDCVQLVGVFHERLNRPIPGFCGQTPIRIGYPLVLDAPIYLQSVAKGDRARFRWLVSCVTLAVTMEQTADED
ncbi:hypothetical protein PG994_013595 [Apiospora phragmitis]|uniref:DUF7932 domain-containing protein n=1 Tax=Apiospora phragmitis TaxID=2905665 RepID=A0ABR1T924_9PEZI